MLDKHAEFCAGLGRIERLLRTVREHRASVGRYDPVTSDDDHAMQHLSVAFEDIPEDLHEAVRVVLMHPAEDASLRDRVADVVKNACGGGWGEIEYLTSRLSLLHILSGLSFHSPYTYRVDGKVIRGSRPTPGKLARLHAAGVRATVNLCREMPVGDDDLIRAAGLTEQQMESRHIEITDNTPPAAQDVQQLLTYLASVDGQVYVHCEAGVGRTGVMVACYRIARGWTLANALHEARQFGCSMPGQLAFIEDWARAAGASGSADLQPGDAVLRETVQANVDPRGLDRALA